jgi:histidinol-phosphate/aromatic aminotransferase/cobyric acid decarboxylase-like protein
MITDILNKLYKSHENKLDTPITPEPSVEEYKVALSQLQAQLAAVYKDNDYLKAQNTLLMSQLVTAQQLSSMLALTRPQTKDPKDKATVGFSAK